MLYTAIGSIWDEAKVGLRIRTLRRAEDVGLYDTGCVDDL